MTARPLTFPGARGQPLAARLELPADARPRAYALFAHCFTCSKDIKAAVHIARELTGYGLAVLRFDFTGLGESAGDFADTSFSSTIEDLVAACTFLSEAYETPTVLIGHSLGGAAVLHAAAQLPQVQAVATIGAPFEPAHVKHLFANSEEEIRDAGHATVAIGGRPFTVRKAFLDDLDGARSERVIAGLKRALLVMHSPVDATVGIENAARIYQAAKHPKSFISLDTADHLLTRERDSRYAAAVLGAWVGRYVPPATPPTVESLRGDHRVVAAIGASGYRTEIQAGGHILTADEPVAVGGTDTGPNPYDLLAAALGACTTMTLRMYADRKGWPLEGVTVGLSHRRVHAEDEAGCEDRPARVDEIERRIGLEGRLDDAQRARLIEIADRCPVHRTLDAGVRIATVPETQGQQGVS